MGRYAARHRHVSLHRAHDLVDADAHGMPRTLESATSEARTGWRTEAGASEALLEQRLPQRRRHANRSVRRRTLESRGRLEHELDARHRGRGQRFPDQVESTLRQRLYGPARRGNLDGEYIDSSEGYVTDELDFRRDHFAAADTPLIFSLGTHRPAIFRGLIAFEYIRAIAADVHGNGQVHDGQRHRQTGFAG